MMRHSVQKLLKQRDDMLLLSGSVLLLSSVFFFFGPLQLYIVNITELWFSFWDVFWPSLITFFIVSCILMGLGVLLYRWKKLFYGYDALLCGLGIALYIQGNFLPFPYGILNGNTINWDSYRHEAVISGLVWVLCLAIPLVLIFAFQAKGKQVLKYGSFCVILVQLLVLVTLSATTDFSQSSVPESFLSDNGLYEVSENENVIVFVLDSLDESFLEDIYFKESDFLDFLDGFTWFTNATSSYPNTRGSLPYILTGQFYQNDQPYNEYIVDAWENANHYQIMKEQGYGINIYTPLQSVVSENAKNSIIDNSVMKKIEVSNVFHLEAAILHLTSMRFFPDATKELVWTYNDLFEKLQSSSENGVEPYTWKITNFYQHLLDDKLSTVEGKKFQFIHLDGVHVPYTVLEDLSEDTTEANEITETKGSFNVVCEYLNQLKELGVYDKTYIIITADHGYLSNYPFLLVKPFSSTGELKLNHNPISHTNLIPTIMEGLGECGFGNSVFEQIDNSKAVRRCFRYTMNGEVEWNKEFFTDMEEFHAISTEDNITLLLPTGRIYTDSGITKFELPSNQCLINQPIALNNKGMERFTYFLFHDYGAQENINMLWSVGHFGQGRFKINEVKQDLICRICLGTVYANSQHILVKSHGKVLYDGIATMNIPFLNFSIPKTCIENGEIILDFEFPDACSPSSLGKGPDPRKLGVGFKEILFTEQNRTEEITFTLTGNAEDYIYSGWHKLEKSGCWTNGNSSFMAVLPEKTSNEMEITYLSNPVAGNTKVYCNDKYVGMLPKRDGFSQETVILPAEYLSDLGGQKISFVTDGVTTYLGKGGIDGTDTRPVGIYVSNVRFEVSNREAERKISFEKGGDSQKYLYNGWYEQEEDARWAGETAELIISFPEETSQQMKLNYLTNPAAGDTEVYYNNHYVGTLPHHSVFKQETIVLPAEYKDLSGEQIIRFNTNDATTYLGTGGIDGTDLRTVSIYISEMEFEPVK